MTGAARAGAGFGLAIVGVAFGRGTGARTTGARTTGAGACAAADIAGPAAIPANAVNTISDFERLGLASNNPFISKDNPHLPLPCIHSGPRRGQ